MKNLTKNEITTVSGGACDCTCFDETVEEEPIRKLELKKILKFVIHIVLEKGMLIQNADLYQ